MNNSYAQRRSQMLLTENLPAYPAESNLKLMFHHDVALGLLSPRAVDRRVEPHAQARGFLRRRVMGFG